MHVGRRTPTLEMASQHVVYPGDIGDRIEDRADELDTSVSGYYKELARRDLQQQIIEDNQ